MNNNQIATQQPLSFGALVDTQSIQAKFQKFLGDKAPQFLSTLVTVVNNNPMLANIAKTNPLSILASAASAACFNLSVHPSLGEAALIPYGNQCQFQIMKKGWINLALRNKHVVRCGVTPIYEGQLKSFDPLEDEYELGAPASDKVVGYMAKYRTDYGFQKVVYMTIAEIKKHGEKYSKTYKNPNGQWQQNFDAMAEKTVLKKLLTTWAPGTDGNEEPLQKRIIEEQMDRLQQASRMDQAAISQSILEDTDVMELQDSDIQYVDNEPTQQEKEQAKVETDAKKAAVAEAMNKSQK